MTDGAARMPTQWLLTSAISAASFAAFDPHGSMPHMNLCASKKIRVVHHLFATEEEEAIEAPKLKDVSAEDAEKGGVYSTIEAPKLNMRAEDAKKGGVYSSEPIAAFETIARIPRVHVLQPVDVQCEGKAGWAAGLVAAALTAVHGDASDGTAKQSWVENWQGGGWASDVADLGRSGIRYGRDDATGSLIATGSDNDASIFSIFKFPCHPVVYRASLGLASLTRSNSPAALAALVARGFAYRSIRDELLPLVSAPSERAKGSMRDKRAWDVADTFNRVLARATTLAVDSSEAASAVVVPLYDRLEQCEEGVGANVKLELDPSHSSDEVLLVATREIAAGEAITRDYDSDAPRLPGDTSEGALRLLLQFGVLPSAWLPDAGWDAVDKSLEGPAEGRREVAW